jgi:hypothetical protein
MDRFAALHSFHLESMVSHSFHDKKVSIHMRKGFVSCFVLLLSREESNESIRNDLAGFTSFSFLHLRELPFDSMTSESFVLRAIMSRHFTTSFMFTWPLCKKLKLGTAGSFDGFGRMSQVGHVEPPTL